MPQVSRDLAEELLAEPVEQGQTLLERARLIGDFSDYEDWKAAGTQWIEHTAQILGQIYGGSEQADRFKSVASYRGTGERWQIEYERDSDCLRAVIDVLISLPDQPEFAQDVSSAPGPAPGPSIGVELALASSVGSGLAPEPSGGSEPAHQRTGAAGFAQSSANGSVSSLPATTSAGPEKDHAGQVFLVHGRDETWKQAVAGLLERARPDKVTVLEELAGNERPATPGVLVERFKKQGSGGRRYAVILLTADDIGAQRPDSDREPYFSPRACQDVVFKMGVLVAALTARFVCVLYEDGVELPCDLESIAYIRLDVAGAWRSKLLLQLRSAGFDYDLNMLAPV